MDAKNARIDADEADNESRKQHAAEKEAEKSAAPKNKPAADGKIHKFALDHKRSEMFLLPPRKCIIIGKDTPHKQDHELWRADVKNPPPDYLINSIRKHGVLQPIRARKIEGNFDEVEVVMGRDRVKSARVVEDGGQPVLVPVILYRAGTPISEIIGAANAENFARKTESLISQAEHVWMQLRAEGYFDGADEAECIKNVSVSTGFSAQRIKNLLAFREDDKLVKAVKLGLDGKEGGIKGEAAYSLAQLPAGPEREAEFKKVLANPNATVVEVRENVSRRKNKIKATKKGKKADDVAVGFSKHSMRKMVMDQNEKRKEGKNDVDDLVIKVMEVLTGEAPPTAVKGFTKAMRAVGLLDD